MTFIQRKNGQIEDSELSGNTVLTINLQGIVPASADTLDRILQNAMIEMGVDTTWREIEPPPLDPEPQDARPPEPQETPEAAPPA